MSRQGPPSRGQGSRGRRKRFGDNGFEEQGGYMNAKKSKLEEQFSKEASKECLVAEQGIFHNVAIFVNGYTDPPADDLKRIMMVNGGTFHTYLSHKTTHIIAKNLPDTKVKRLKGTEPICHPGWITESMKAGRLLDFTQFLVYSNQSCSQPKLNFGAKNEAIIEHLLGDVNLDRSTTHKNHAPETDKKHGRALDAKDEKFLGEFYNNSRLHHISTMGASFKSYVADLRNNDSAFKFPRREKLLKMANDNQGKASQIGNKDKVIMHIDMDCFFVSVGLRNHPHLRGLPVAVTHAKAGVGSSTRPSNADIVRKEAEFYESRHGTDNSEVRPKSSSLLDIADIAESDKFTSMSEIASCSYEARKVGVKNGMFMGTALKLCPGLQTIPYDFEGYQEVAKTLYDTVAQYTLDIQAVSCDELLVDLTELLTECRIGSCEFAKVLRAEIFEATNCTASVGLGPSLLLSRLATRKAKPDGIFFLQKEEAKDYMKSVAVQDLPGVGRKVTQKLETLGIGSCAELQKLSLDRLIREFGPKSGQSLYEFCRGIDSRTINFVQDRKSVSAEINYGIRFETEEDAKKFLAQLSEEVHQRMVKLGNVRGKGITLKVMVRALNASTETAKFLGHGACDSYSRSSNLSTSTNDANVILHQVMQLLRQLNVDVRDLRGLGIQVTKLDCANHSNKLDEKGSTKSILDFVKKMEVTNTTLAGSSPRDSTNTRSSNFDDSRPSVHNLNKSANEDRTKANAPEQIPFSMLDQDVLKELPEDVKKEILDFYKNQEQTCDLPKKVDKNSEKSFMGESVKQKALEPKPGPSTNSGQQLGLSYADLSLSQLDPGVMAALPEDIQREVKLHFNAKVSPIKTAFDEMKISALVEACSPTKVVGKRRGRPPKNDPRFIKKTRKVLSRSPLKPQKIISNGEMKVCNDNSNWKEVFVDQDEPVKVPKATLDGRRSIEELRLLFTAWIRSTSTPTKDDRVSVSTFLCSVVQENDLELVYACLKTLSRLCHFKETSEPVWGRCYEIILDEVQQEMKRFHGHHMFADFKF